MSRARFYELRTKAGLSQRELAKRIGTSAANICRLENADYEGHSLSMLRRIAAALEMRVDVRFVPIRARLSEFECEMDEPDYDDPEFRRTLVQAAERAR